MKKALSLILAMMLVVGLIPAAFASDAPPAEGYTYVFSNAAHTGSAGNTGSVSFATTMQSIETTDTSVSARWGYVAEAFPVADSSCTDSSQMRLSYYRPNYDINKAVTFDPDMEGTVSALCLELEVTDGGTFVPTLNYTSHSLGPIVELYLVPKSDVSDVITNDNLSDFVKKDLDPKYRIGTVDAYSGSSLEMRSVELKNNTNCYFIMVPNGENESVNPGSTQTFHYFLPKSLSFTPREGEYEKYDYLFTMNGGIDIDTGDGTGMKQDTEMSDDEQKKGNSTVGYWKNGTDYMLYNTAIERFIKDDYIYIDTAKSGKWSFGGQNGRASMYINKNGYMMSVGDGSTPGSYFALKLYVENPDTYTMSFQRTSLSYNAEVQFSFFPADKELNSENIAANTVGDKIDLQTANGEVTIGKVTANAAGKYYLVVSYTGLGSSTWTNNVRGAHLKSVHLTATTPTYAAEPGDDEINVSPDNATAEDGKATISNEVSALAKDTDGNAVENAVTKNESSVTAEKNVSDYEFLYWAKGIGYNQKKVSTDLTYNYTKETEKLWLYAVYRNTKEAAKNATFYNANGDILATVAIADGKVRTPALTNVSLAGYGTVKGWKYAADGVTYGANEEVTVTGDALFVADYDELNTSIDITATNGKIIVEGGKEKPLFGDKVTVTAPARKDNTKLFNYWKKGDEIVSFDREYSFCAWEACTLTAVYSDYVPLADTVRKIILGNAGNTYVAEFIGFDGADVIERGIAFATEGNASYASINRAVMTKKDLNHLAAVNDIEATSVVGYVIDKEGNVYYSK